MGLEDRLLRGPCNMNVEFFLLAVCILAIELALSIGFVRQHFQFGLPIFWYRTRLTAGEASPASPSQNGHTLVFQRLKFRELRPDFFGFREQAELGPVVYPPVMRGNLTIDRANSRVTVIGLMNFFPVFFWLAVIDFDNLGARTDHLLFPPLVLVAIYSIQFLRFRRVALQASWRAN